MRSLKSIARIYTLAWEGGHPDHDAAQSSPRFAVSRGLSDRVRQVAFYRASDRWPAPLFTIGSPLAANGPVRPVSLSSRERWLPLRLMRFFRSQWRSFAGLAPIMLWHALSRRALALQPLDQRRLTARPTARPLLYEARNGVSFDDFLAAAAPFLARHADTRPNDAPSFATPDRLTA